MILRFTHEAIKQCFDKAYLYIVPDDGQEGYVDYTKCALFDFWGKEPYWEPLPPPTTTTAEPTEEPTYQPPGTTVWPPPTDFFTTFMPRCPWGPCPWTTSPKPPGGCFEDGPFTEPVQQIETGLRCDTGPDFNVAKIVGGNVVNSTASFPWQVRLSINGEYQCGGSIVDDTWILSAAHCCENDPSIIVHVGDLDQYDADAGEFSVVASEIHLHWRWGKDSTDHAGHMSGDLCLLKVPSLAATAAESSCNNCYGHICLPADDYEHGEACFVSGWGTMKMGGGGAVSQNLRQVGLNLFRYGYCNDRCHTLDNMNTYLDLEICAGKTFSPEIELDFDF